MLKPNLDPQEIAKFTQLASSWWDPQGDCKPLHDINPLRVKFIQDRAQLAAAKVIDIGCGGGILTESLGRHGAEVIGIDASEEAINIAQAHCAQDATIANIAYQVTTAEAMADAYPGTFDIVTCMELLEHVPDPASVIAACAKLVKPGGKLFFSTLNRNPKAYLFAVIGAEYLLKLLPKGTHDYAKFIRPAELAAWARSGDLEVHEFKGMHYNPLTQRYSLNDDISVNYFVYCTRGCGEDQNNII